MRARIFRTASAPLVALALACGGSEDGTGPEESDLHGTFTLQTINGAGLPFVVWDDEDGKFEVVSGQIVLGMDGRFVDQTGYRTTEVGGVPDPFEDTLTGRFFHDVGLGRVLFQVDDGGVYELTLRDDGTLVELLDGGYELVYGM